MPAGVLAECGDIDWLQIHRLDLSLRQRARLFCRTPHLPGIRVRAKDLLEQLGLQRVDRCWSHGHDLDH